MDDDLESFSGSAKPSAAPSNAGSYAPSPANMASPAASLGVPDNQQDADFFGNVRPAAQKASASPAHSAHAQQSAMDPFDLFGEGSTVPASAAAGSHQAAASQHAGADDDLFGGAQGNQGVSQFLPYSTHALVLNILMIAWHAAIRVVFQRVQLCSSTVCTLRRYSIHP